VFEVLEEAHMPANIRDDAFIEQLARSIHEDYVAKNAGGPQQNPAAVPWEDLSDDLRQANVAQAMSIGAKLETIRAVPVPQSANVPAFHFTDEEIEELAEQEHERWMGERIARGWSYGATRDNARKLHPSLISWADLPEDERKKDRDAIRAIPGILRDAGYQIRRLPDP